jgi:DNA-binding protein HU-beta
MATQPATAAKPKVNTVSLKHLAAALAESHEMPKKQSEAILNDLVGLVTKHLKKGDRIRLVGLGVLVVRKRAARMGRNPATGEPIQIKASKKVAFRASKELKEAVFSRSRNIFAQLGSGWAIIFRRFFFRPACLRRQCSLAASSPVRFSRMN